MKEVNYPAIERARRDHAEQFVGLPNASGRTVGDFWAWAYSDILLNTTRGVLAEYLVVMAVGDGSVVRDAWAPFDVSTREGVTVEVKSAAYLQSWSQKNLSKITFGCRPTMGTDDATGLYAGLQSRKCDVWVFALLHHEDPVTINPLDASHWSFWVVPTGWLDEHMATAKTISLARLRASPYGQPFTVNELADAIQDVAV
ncbi:MAG: hypothetical protein CVT64_11185 [Actinobacteria bacterium HGW-Actinobacteria-4]|nr:MAG: hypothetical protein CVT64_11185 [Actinobacteria bacterium HGW-Actinobacteria-4]